MKKVFFFFFFKQKTAYEITRRDWSSDVCSSDLLSRVIWLIARATEDVGTSTITSTFSASYHWRAMLEPTSGLFRWSATTISTFRPFFAAPKSSTARRAAVVEPGP